MRLRMMIMMMNWSNLELWSTSTLLQLLHCYGRRKQRNGSFENSSRREGEKRGESLYSIAGLRPRLDAG